MLEIIAWLNAIVYLLWTNGYVFIGFLALIALAIFTHYDNKRVDARIAAKRAKAIADAMQSNAMQSTANAVRKNANAMQSNAKQNKAMQSNADAMQSNAMHCPNCNAEVNRNSYYRVQKRGYCSKCKLNKGK